MSNVPREGDIYFLEPWVAAQRNLSFRNISKFVIVLRLCRHKESKRDKKRNPERENMIGKGVAEQRMARMGYHECHPMI